MHKPDYPDGMAILCTLSYSLQCNEIPCLLDFPWSFAFNCIPWGDSVTHRCELQKTCASLFTKSFSVLTCTFYSGKFLFVSKSNYFLERLGPKLNWSWLVSSSFLKNKIWICHLGLLFVINSCGLVISISILNFACRSSWPTLFFHSFPWFSQCLPFSKKSLWFVWWVVPLGGWARKKAKIHYCEIILRTEQWPLRGHKCEFEKRCFKWFFLHLHPYQICLSFESQT